MKFVEMVDSFLTSLFSFFTHKILSPEKLRVQPMICLNGFFFLRFFLALNGFQDWKLEFSSVKQLKFPIFRNDTMISCFFEIPFYLKFSLFLTDKLCDRPCSHPNQFFFFFVAHKNEIRNIFLGIHLMNANEYA